MEQNKQKNANKGGRPRKENKKCKVLTMKCTSKEHEDIVDKSRQARLTLSKYLVTAALNAVIESRHVALPSDVLKLIGTLNHMGANLNQIAKKLNSVTGELSLLERVNIRVLPKKLLDLTAIIKTYFQ